METILWVFPGFVFCSDTVVLKRQGLKAQKNNTLAALQRAN